MPRISYFHGITIAMFWREGGHQAPHFHAAHGERVASIGLDGQVLAGEITRRDLALVREWAEIHRPELTANWERVKARQPLAAIPPLS